jgi:hypothetical protein
MEKEATKSNIVGAHNAPTTLLSFTTCITRDKNGCQHKDEQQRYGKVAI